MEPKEESEKEETVEKMLEVHLTDCSKGLGMKIIGGLDPNGNYTGIFVKQILPDGCIDKDGQINLGDMICEVNDYDLRHCSQADAISYLRVAAQSGEVRLLVDNTQQAQELFLALFENRRPSQPTTKPNNLTDPSQETGNDKKSLLNIHSPSFDSGLYGSSFNSHDVTHHDVINNDPVKTVFILHETSLGISLGGGTDKQDGPNIFISDIVSGSDVFNEGSLRTGDVIMSINGESFVGLTNEQAKSSLSRMKLRKDLRSFQIAYVEKEQIHLIKEQITPRRNLPSTSTPQAISTNGAFQSTPRKQNDSLLNELYDVMADIQESESEIDWNSQKMSPQELKNGEDDVFVKHIPPQRTISHYLQQDVPSSQDEVARKKAKRPSETLSLEAHTTIKLEKLEGALQHLGLSPNQTQRKEIRKRLQSDVDGSVTYGDFVRIAREVLHLNNGLKDRTQSLKNKSLTFQKSIIEEMDTTTTQVDENENMISCNDEIYRLRRERDEALRDARYYRDLLHEKDADCLQLEEDLQVTQQQVAVARRECNTLRYESRKEIEASQHHHEQQTEKTIERLEQENSVLRSNSLGTKDLKDLQKRLVVVGCQLRKTEISKRSYEVAVDKLTKFVEKVHLNLDSQQDTSSSKRTRNGSKELSNEAKETIRNVKMLLEEEPLPFGWEEVYSPEGTRYYMNHVTQTTSWVHPISSVSRKPKSVKSRKNSASSKSS